MADRRLLTIVARVMGIGLIAALIAVHVGCQTNASPAPAGPQTETVTIDGHTFELEVAADTESRTRGLMHRESIPEDGGMIFIFPDRAVRGFWMGYCLVDIDIMYLDGRGYVTAVHRMVAEEPRRPDETEMEYDQRLRRYSSILPAQFAIELQAGWLDRLDIGPNDRIELDLERLKAMAR